MDTAAFDYDLPDERVAQTPADPRESARLLVDRGPDQPSGHHTVAELPSLLEPGDLVVVNDTRVIPARLHLRRSTGAAIEVLLLEELGPRQWEGLVRPSRKVRSGEPLDDGAGLQIIAEEPIADGRWRLRFAGEDPVADLLLAHGEIPLPPYITTPLADPERYQTVFAARPASVAAPTAGLHLSPPVLEQLTARQIDLVRVELVVGLGTFRPIVVDRVEDHPMHGETYRINPEVADRLTAAPRVVAIGTTVVRALESWAATGQLQGRTELYIHGDYPFRVVDRLLTNFHVPRSSLLVLVDAFVGPRWRDLYAEALASGYRFLSFGDAMLLTRGRR